MTTLLSVSINFHTHISNASALFSVYLKNRSYTTSTPDSDTTYIANHLSYAAYQQQGRDVINPYLGAKENVYLQPDANGNQNVVLDMVRADFPVTDLILPAVSIHLLPSLAVSVNPEATAQWIFDFSMNFQYSDLTQQEYTYNSTENGEPAIVLDTDSPDYSCICKEIPNSPLPTREVPDMNAILTAATVTIHTLPGSTKPADTKLDIRLSSRAGGGALTDIATMLNAAAGQAFPDDTTNIIDMQVLSGAIQLRDLVLPVIRFDITPNGKNIWKFAYRLELEFLFEATPSTLKYSYTRNGVVLTETARTHVGVYQGDALPEIAPVLATLSGPAVGSYTKSISVDFINKKLNDFINNRQSQDPASSEAALRLLVLDNTGLRENIQPSSFYNLKAIEANPLPPGTPDPANYDEPVLWTDGAVDLGQLSTSAAWGLLTPRFYLNNLNSRSITAKLDPTQPYPLIVTIDFDTNQKCGITGTDATTAYFKTFTIDLNFSLTAANGIIDFVGWAVDPSVNLDDVVHIDLVTTETSDPGGYIRTGLQGRIADAIRQPDKLTGRTGRDAINDMANAWLLGGAAANDPVASPVNYNNVTSVGWNSDKTELQVTYSGPSATFEFPDKPANWPAGYDFDPGLLANLDHLVVLMMENRSFDHMLGYLSMPPAQGGLGRAEVCGLKGNEINYLDDGTPCPVKPCAPGETVFAPDPPHSFGPVQTAIHRGAMDGFAESYAEDSGPTVGPNIMKYHTAATVPVFDALARDFAICHRWFAAHPGPTFCNRFSTISGRLNIDPNGFWELSNSQNLRPVFTPTIFDALNDPQATGGQTVTWKYFEHYYCYLRLFQAYTFNTQNIFDFTDAGLGFANVAATGNLPNVTFIDPHFIELPPDSNCDGPPADVAQGQKLVQQVVDAVVSSPNWSKTMLIITYDEHGGFFDHVPPPPAPAVAPGLPTTYGVRVPAFVISPWVAGGSVFGSDATSTSSALHFDHASIMRTIANRFLKSPPYFGPRFTAANDLSKVMLSQPRVNSLLPFIPYNLTYGASKKQLEVQAGNISPGASIVQDDPNTQDAQRFCFEDAGNGAFRIRTRTGNLYLTADSTGIPAGSPVPVKLDVEHPASGNPAQLWSIRPFPLFVGRNAVQATISNAAFSGMLLHPSADSTASGSAVVLETLPTAGFTLLHSPYEWLISSPLIPGPGQVTGEPVINAFQVTPNSLSFPTTHVSTPSGEQQFVISTNQPFTITGIAIKDASAASADFTSVPKPGSPPPGAPVTSTNNSLTVYVWFTPTGQGSRSAQIEITHNLSDQPLIVPLSGTGDAAPAPLIAVSPTSLSFNQKKLTNHTVTVSNHGTAPLHIGSVAVSGNPSNYSVINACGAPGTLQPGQSCTITVNSFFQGSGDSSLLVITHDAFGSPTEIGLESTGKTGVPR